MAHELPASMGLRRLVTRLLHIGRHTPHAIYECRECGHQVGVRVDSCPECDSEKMYETTP